MERDLAPNDVLAIDMYGPFTPSLVGNLYMFYGKDHATGYIVNYGLRRKSEALAVFTPTPTRTLTLTTVAAAVVAK